MWSQFSLESEEARDWIEGEEERLRREEEERRELFSELEVDPFGDRFVEFNMSNTRYLSWNLKWF